MYYLKALSGIVPFVLIFITIGAADGIGTQKLHLENWEYRILCNFFFNFGP